MRFIEEKGIGTSPYSQWKTGVRSFVTMTSILKPILHRDEKEKG
jgi:hypothetical protein